MRIIDADELKEQLKERYLKAVEWKSKTVYYERADGEIAAFLEAVRTLNNASTIDAVPVVRCKDCMYCDKHTCNFWGEIVGIRVSEDGYCNNGIKEKEKK